MVVIVSNNTNMRKQFIDILTLNLNMYVVFTLLVLFCKEKWGVAQFTVGMTSLQFCKGLRY